MLTVLRGNNDALTNQPEGKGGAQPGASALDAAITLVPLKEYVAVNLGAVGRGKIAGQWWL
jgi:hypothetical protein